MMNLKECINENIYQEKNIFSLSVSKDIHSISGYMTNKMNA